MISSDSFPTPDSMTEPASASTASSAADSAPASGVLTAQADPLAAALHSLDAMVSAEEAGHLGGTVPAPASGDGKGPANGPGQDPASGIAPGANTEEPQGGNHGSSSGSARREEILDGAAALFAERGYHGSSLRDISRRVGISHPGMLHYFSSKEALLGAVLDRLEAHAQGLLDSVPQLQRSPRALLAALGGPWDPSSHPIQLLATLCAESVNPQHPGRFRVARLRLVHENILARVLSAFGERGLLVEGADPAFFARSTVSVMLSLSVRENSVRALQTTSDVGDPVQDLRRVVSCYLRD